MILGGWRKLWRLKLMWKRSRRLLRMLLRNWGRVLHLYASSRNTQRPQQPQKRNCWKRRLLLRNIQICRRLGRMSPLMKSIGSQVILISRQPIKMIPRKSRFSNSWIRPRIRICLLKTLTKHSRFWNNMKRPAVIIFKHHNFCLLFRPLAPKT